MKSQAVRPQPMSHPTQAVTRLSGRAGCESSKISDLLQMARVSLCLVLAALGGPGCLVTTSPDFAKPKITPPLLTVLAPEPFKVHQVTTVAGSNNTYNSVKLDVTVVSEDLGSPGLVGHLLEDFKGFGEEMAFTRLNPETITVQPGHIDSPTREIKPVFTFPPREPGFPPGEPGCHSATLILTHAFKDPGAKILVLADPSDVGTATWWFAVGVDGTSTDFLKSCIVVSGTQADAGTDADARPQ
jgi:hypothetical protein